MERQLGSFSSPFPSYSEALGAALRSLPTEEVEMMIDHQPHGWMRPPEEELAADAV